MIHIKTWPYIRKNIKMLLRHEWYMIIVFLALTITIACMFGIMMKASFDGTNTMKPVSINISFDRESQIGKILAADLTSDTLQELFRVDNQNYECKVSISDDFNNIIIENISSTDARVQIVSKFFNTFTNNINVHQNVMKKASLSENRDAAMKSVSNTFLDNMKHDGITENIINGYKTLNSFEYYSISILSFTSFVIIYLFVNKYFDENNQGIISRSLIAPHKKGEYLTGYLASIFILTALTNLIYISIMKVCGFGFKENFIGTFIIMLCQSLMQISIAGVVSVYAKTKNSVNAVIILLIILPAAFGGTFTNIDSVKNSITRILQNLCPNTLIINSYINYEKSGVLNDSTVYLLAMTAISILCISAMYLKSEKKLYEFA